MDALSDSFDAKVEALEFFLTRLLVNDCRSQSDPAAALAALQHDAQAQADLPAQFCFSRPTDDVAGQRAFVVSTEIQLMADRIAEEFHAPLSDK